MNLVSPISEYFESLSTDYRKSWSLGLWFVVPFVVCGIIIERKIGPNLPIPLMWAWIAGSASVAIKAMGEIVDLALKKVAQPANVVRNAQISYDMPPVTSPKFLEWLGAYRNSLGWIYIKFWALRIGNPSRSHLLRVIGILSISCVVGGSLGMAIRSLNHHSNWFNSNLQFPDITTSAGHWSIPLLLIVAGMLAWYSWYFGSKLDKLLRAPRLARDVQDAYLHFFAVNDRKKSSKKKSDKIIWERHLINLARFLIEKYSDEKPMLCLFEVNKDGDLVSTFPDPNRNLQIYTTGRLRTIGSMARIAYATAGSVYVPSVSLGMGIEIEQGTVVGPLYLPESPKIETSLSVPIVNRGVVEAILVASSPKRGAFRPLTLQSFALLVAVLRTMRSRPSSSDRVSSEVYGAWESKRA